MDDTKSGDCVDTIIDEVLDGWTTSESAGEIVTKITNRIVENDEFRASWPSSEHQKVASSIAYMAVRGRLGSLADRFLPL